jgi:hypothetical protein
MSENKRTIFALRFTAFIRGVKKPVSFLEWVEKSLIWE